MGRRSTRRSRSRRANPGASGVYNLHVRLDGTTEGRDGRTSPSGGEALDDSSGTWFRCHGRLTESRLTRLRYLVARIVAAPGERWNDVDGRVARRHRHRSFDAADWHRDILPCGPEPRRGVARVLGTDWCCLALSGIAMRVGGR